MMNAGALADPILDYAGRDVSHWFDEKTGDVSSIRLLFATYGFV